MSTRIVPVEVFERWLAKEYRKQKSRSSETNTIAKYRAYAVGNAWAIWKRDTAALVNPDADLATKIYRDFYKMVERGSKTNASKGTNEGYGIVLAMLRRTGVEF